MTNAEERRVELLKMLHEVWARNRDIPAEEIERDVADAIQDVRQSKKSPELPCWPGDVKGTLTREAIYEDL